MAPQALSVLLHHRVVVTLHEFTQAHPARKISVLPLLLAASHVIFTTEYERGYSLSLLPFLRGRSSVIPIASNVPYVDGNEPRNQRMVCYFGLIRPKKEISDFLTLAVLAREKSIPLEFVIVGKPVAGYEEYASSLLLEAGRLGIRFYSGLKLSEVAKVLSSATFAYLPFRDGASERRGSLLAALGNGLVVLTTIGAATTPALRNVVVPVESPQVALNRIGELLGDGERRSAVSRLARDYALEFSWSRIAADHLRLYRELSE
jgi:glycosyltransferase involved in cell wall biosynthesis